MTDIVASRSFQLDGRDRLVARIGRPSRQGRSWRVLVELRGPHGLRRQHCGGADSLQAVLMAVYVLQLWLDTHPLRDRLGLDGFRAFFDLPEWQHHPRHPGIPPGHAGGLPAP